MRGKQARPIRTLGELIARRRQELGLTQAELGLRLRGRHGSTVSQERIHDIETERMGPVRLPILAQLPRALKLAREVVYFWGGRLPPDIRPGGLSATTVKAAWAALRAVFARARSQSRARRAVKRRPPPPRRKPGREPGLRGWRGRNTLGGLIAWRRRKLGLTAEALSELVRGEQGEPLSKQRLSDIEHDRFGIPRRRLLRQLARALKLTMDVLYLWAGRLPPDIRPAGMLLETFEIFLG